MLISDEIIQVEYVPSTVSEMPSRLISQVTRQSRKLSNKETLFRNRSVFGVRFKQKLRFTRRNIFLETNKLSGNPSTA